MAWPAALPVYADTDNVHATYDDVGGGGINGWLSALNFLLTVLQGTDTTDVATLVNPTINAYTEGYLDAGTVGASYTIAISAATVQVAELTSATPCTFTMPAVVNGKSFMFGTVQPATGTATTATFTGVDWGAAGTPSLTPALGALDVFSFVGINGKWRGAVGKGYTY